jgi:hypothetical protein
MGLAIAYHEQSYTLIFRAKIREKPGYSLMISIDYPFHPLQELSA